jgi:hypothetical protein
MIRSRRLRLLTAVVALFSLLFMQVALAGYACPDLVPAPNVPMLDAAGQPMVDCPQVDRDSPSLCHAHTHKIAQSLDKPDAPSVLPFIATGFALPILWPADTASLAAPPLDVPHPAGASPPIAIRHCCFRL